MSEPLTGLDEAVETDLRQALFVGLNLDQGDDACGDYVADIVRMIEPTIAAVRADERAKVLAAVDAAIAKTAAFAGQAEDIRYARACVIRALTEPTP